MTTILELPNGKLTAEEIIPLMTRYQLMPQFLRNFILDRAIADITFTPTEREAFCQQFSQGYDQESTTGWNEWIDRQLKIRKFQQQQWSRRLENYFLERKGQCDRVVCSLIHVQDMGIAEELYFRIVEGEQSFEQIAGLYSQGPEAQTNGIVAIELGQLHPVLAQRFLGGRPGQLWYPTKIGEWIVLARLEALLPAQLDEAMRQVLLDELLEAWLQQQVAL